MSKRGTPPRLSQLTTAILMRRSLTRSKQMTKTIEFEAVETDQPPETTLGNKLKFKLECMFMMLHADRREAAAQLYDQLIEEFDKLK